MKSPTLAVSNYCMLMREGNNKDGEKTEGLKLTVEMKEYNNVNSMVG